MSNLKIAAGLAAASIFITSPFLSSTAIAQSAGNVEMPPNVLVRTVVANELKPTPDDHTRWMYEVSKEEDGHTQTKEVVQTRDGAVERLIAMDGQSLSVQKQEEEKGRIKNLISHPREQEKLEQARKKDAAQCEAFFRMIPDAFIFSYAGRDGDLIKLTFKPNPNFDPPTREARVFHSMEGEMMVRSKDLRLASITGRLIEDVKFGGGLLAHLEKGGEFRVERKDIGNGHWEMTAMEVCMKGKALFLKSIAVQEKESRQGFRKVAENLSVADAAEILEKPVVVAARR